MTRKRAVQWTETLATGIRTIDQQHYELLSGINDLISLHQAGQSTQALDELLPSLKTYVLFHFREEEMLLARAVGGTEFQRQHLAQHREFALEIENHCQRRATQSDAEIAKDLGHYLENWVLSHIAGADQKLARLVRAYGQLWL
jgi:hemerythrin-like metal-binding protein